MLQYTATIKQPHKSVGFLKKCLALHMEENKCKYHRLELVILDESSESSDSDHNFCEAKQEGCLLLIRNSRPRTKSDFMNSTSGPCDPRQQQHRCILLYETMELICSRKQLDPFLLRYNWTPAFAGPGWIEYHYHSFEKEHKLLKTIRVPELLEDARKKDILKLVRTVNRMANENLLCAWVHREPVTSTRVQHGRSVISSWTYGRASVSTSSISRQDNEKEA